MGTATPEKKAKKKMKNIKKRRHELVENGESAPGSSTVKIDDKYSTIEKDQNDVAGADAKAYKRKKARKNKSKDDPSSIESSLVASDGPEIKPDTKDSIKPKKGKLKKALKKKKKDGDSTHKNNNLMKDDHLKNKKGKSVKVVHEIEMPDIYEISSGEEDDSKGMKKWIKEFHERRPGVKELQERIDNFIIEHEERQQQAKRDKEAKLAEDGWTVVVHRKGGKKTTDPESGVAVGSVAEAAVRDKLTKKKDKDIGLDFYRFHRREAHRSELMKLQSKFEEDKKRIQQLRAARKFKPY